MSEDVVKIGLLGLGTVGAGVVNVLERNVDEIARRAGSQIKVVCASARSLDKDRGCNTSEIYLTTDSDEIVNHPDIDVVVELMGGYEPAKSLVLKAIANGKHVVRYFCSTSKLTVDPINGDTFPIKSLVFGKPGSMPNPLYWTNYNDDQKLRNKNSNNVSNGKTMDLRTIKEICLSFGYTEGTEKFADCSMDLYLKNN